MGGREIEAGPHGDRPDLRLCGWKGMVIDDHRHNADLSTFAPDALACARAV